MGQARRLRQPGEIKIGPDIAVDHGKRRIAQQRQRPANTASGFQRCALAGPLDRHTIAAAVAQSSFNPLSEPGGIDHQLAKAGLLQSLDMPFNQAFAAGQQ